MGQGRPIARLKDVQRRRQVTAKPIDASLVDVAAPELPIGVLHDRVPQDATDATSEVKGSLALEAPVAGQQRLDETPLSKTALLEDIRRFTGIHRPSDAS